MESPAASHGPHLDPPAAGQLRCQDPRCSGRIKPLSLWERVAEGRVRVPKNPAAPIHCRRHRPACHESPSPQPSPRGRGGSIDTACTSGWRVQPAWTPPWTPPGSAGCWTATLSGSPLFRPYQTPLPLGEGGRRPGEGPQKPCRSHSLPVDTGLLAAGTLTPTLSQRERGQY